MEKIILLLGTVILFSGCICCGGTDLSGLTSVSSGDADDAGCTPPYIVFGTGCCLDYNSNSICDNDEEQTDDYDIGSEDDIQQDQIDTDFDEPMTYETTTTAQVVQTTTIVTTTLAPATTVAAITKAATYDCIKAAGYNPDSILYFYSTRCGDDFLGTAEMVAVKKGVYFTKIKIGGYQEEKLNNAMECFYGPQNQQWSMCPVLLCPTTGRYEVLTGRGTATVRSQMEGFAIKCG
ncbi:MAG: hypothetical protein KKD39_05295 [Candidatus Altiarchaeota archaeon]|nr:hypothetical protein [Candidatus Altiarchaeota archaeon]